MRLDLGKIINVPGGKESFSFRLGLRDLELNGSCPVQEDVVVAGEVENVAEVLHLSMDLETTLHCTCDRCTKAFTLPKKVHVDNVIVREIQNEEEFDFIVLEEGGVDLGEVARTALILSLEMKMLCREDCKGLCSRCGADLNLGPCSCQPEPDPRFAALRQLLDQ